MERLSKTSAADATRRKEPRPTPSGAAVSDTLSLPSFKEYPSHPPFVNTRVTFRPPSPVKCCPESSSAAILSALRNLQEKITRLESERVKSDSQLRSLKLDSSHKQTQSPKQTLAWTHRDAQADPNKELMTDLAAAESRCVRLERQLENMRRLLLNMKSDDQQVSMATSARGRLESVPEQVHLEKLERLEKEYLKLTQTQSQAEMKIRALELRLQEEEHQRKMVLDKTKEMQSGLEMIRLPRKSESPHQPRVKKTPRQKSPEQQTSCVRPHYRLSLRDVPFIAGKSVGNSHSVAANVQSVLSQLKRHQPHLCNERVLSHSVNEERRFSSSSSSSSSSDGEQEVSGVMQALQEELRLMSIEQQELEKQLQVSVSQRETNDLHHQQEALQLKMDQKGEQISKLYKHKRHLKKLRKEMDSRKGCRTEMRASTSVSCRGRSPGATKARPGERSKKNLLLLRDLRILQTSLRT